MTSGGVYAARQDRLRERMAADGYHAAIVPDLTDVRYLCGFTGSNGLLAVTAGEAAFYTDFRYTQQAAGEVEGARVVTAPDLEAALAADFERLGVAYAGMSGFHATRRRWERIRKLLKRTELADCGNLATALRIVKDASELALMGEASRLAEEAFRRAARGVVAGATEREVALAFHVEALRLGADALSFDTIVAAGERGALPHARPTVREFRDGDLVVFDFGVKLGGYASDQTVTLAVGRVTEEARSVYETVRKAQETALAAVKPGARLAEIDAAARELIAKAGYGDHFGHGTGHGVGMEVHEAPTVSPKSEDSALPGMVFTIEPGIYLPDKFGVRIEDTVVVTEDGSRRITSLQKSFGAFDF